MSDSFFDDTDRDSLRKIKSQSKSIKPTAMSDKIFPLLTLFTTLLFPNLQAIDFNYQKVGSTIEITQYTGIGGSVYIPSTINGLPVTSIGDWTKYQTPTGPDLIGAFDSCVSLTSVTIPSSITNIGLGAFSGCSSLTTITIPNSVKAIDAWAFDSCTSLISVTLSDRITLIPQDAFNGCTSLASITIPNSITSVGNWAFGQNTFLKSITIPNSVTNIGYGAFYGCTSLTSITIPDSVTSIGAGNSTPSYSEPILAAFAGCLNLKYFSVSDTTWNWLTNNAAEFGLNPSQMIQVKPTPVVNFTQPTTPVVYSLGKTLSLSATSTSGGKITFSSSSPSVISVSGSTATVKGIGTTILTATVAATGNYYSASATRSVTVTAATTTVTFTQPSSPVTYAVGKAFSLSTTSSSGGAVTYTSSAPSVISISGSTATVKGVGTATITATVSSTANYTSASVTRRVTVTK